MALYGVAGIDQEPETVLAHYRIYELPNGDRHFCGYVPAHRDGRVSSKIVAWDAGSRIGTTRSGRRYRLAGEPGHDGEAQYVWAAWKRINDVTDFRDVSDEYAPGAPMPTTGTTP